MTSSRPTLKDLAKIHLPDKDFGHSYLAAVYEEVLAPLRDKAISLLEIGVWQGNSLKVWLDWFPQATVLGIDLLLPEMEHERLRLYVSAQDDHERLASILKPNSLDVVIEDGSHHLAHQLQTVHYLWPCLKPGGLYFIEDIAKVEHLEYFRVLPGFRSWDLRELSNQWDDILVLLQKPK